MDQVMLKKSTSIGKRKCAVAEVCIMPGIGQFIINKISAIKYLQFDILKLNKAIIPIKKLGLDKYFNIVVKVKGGGLRGQSEAIQLGVARALCLNNNEYRHKLKTYGFLKRDSRVKERRKYGLKKARKASQYSKR